MALLAFMMMLFGCNSENASLSPIKKTRIHAKVILPSGISPTSMMLFGKNTGGSRFARVMNNSEESFILPSGSWTLYSIAWSAANLQGDVYCETVSADLTGPDLPVEMVLTNNDCDQSHFRGSTSQVAAPLKSLGTIKVEWCEALGNITGATDLCHDDLANPNRKEARGHSTSYRYVLKSYDFYRGRYSILPTSLSSGCLVGVPSAALPLSGAALGEFSQLPTGDGSTTPFYISIEAFPGSTDCTAATHGLKTFNLENGLSESSVDSKYFVEGTAVHKVYLKMTGDDICKDGALTQNFSGGDGTRSSPFLICNETQFYNMRIVPTDSSFKLLADINLTKYYYGITPLPHIPSNLPAGCLEKGSNFLPLGYDNTCNYTLESNPTSDFDGGGKTIIGLRIRMPTKTRVGLFIRKMGGEVRRLNIQNAEIKAYEYGGVIAGLTNASFREIFASSIKVTGRNYLGALAGANNDPGCQFSKLRLEHVNIEAENIYTGGIIGQSNNCQFRTLSVSGKVFSAGSHVGGISGNLTNGRMELVSFEGSVKGLSMVGGLTGEHISSIINESYVQASVVGTTTTSPANVGGLVGFTNGAPGASNSLTNSYIFGQVKTNCPDTTCNASNIVGHPGGWASANFSTNFYVNSNIISGRAGHNFGTQQPPSYFFSTASAFTPTFNLSNSDLPRLPHETSSSLIGHPCRKIPYATESVADQIINGLGTSQNPISICKFSQLTNMRLSSDFASRHFILRGHILATAPVFPVSIDFSGTFNGNNHSIIGFNVRSLVGMEAGWWRSITSNGVIQNLSFIYSSLNDDWNSSTTGLIAKVNHGTLSGIEMMDHRNLSGTSGEHGSLVHTNSGIIQNVILTGTSLFYSKFGGLCFNNQRLIENAVIKYEVNTNPATTAHTFAGIAVQNSGTIRGIDLDLKLWDDSPGTTRANFSFVSVLNSGTIEDLHIRKNILLSRNRSAHAIAVTNSSSGRIRRVFNEGIIQVSNGDLPVLNPTTDDQFIDRASNAVGASAGEIQHIAYRKTPIWHLPSQLGSPIYSDYGSDCQVSSPDLIPAVWQTGISSQQNRFAIMIGVEDPFSFFVAPPSYAGPNVFYFNGDRACNSLSGNPIIAYRPVDFLGDSFQLLGNDHLNFSSFNTWTGVYDITSDDSAIHNYEFYKFNNIQITKPVWIFDSTKSLRLYR